jgi:Thioesterase-like superfamily
MPAAAAPRTLPRALHPKLKWPKRYDMRFITGNLATTWGVQMGDCLTQTWVRAVQERAAVGKGFVLAEATAQSFFNGFFDQSAQLWSEAGTLVATTHQVVYYKE